MNFNNFVVNGRLTRDPEIRDVGEAKVAGFGIAFDTGYKKGQAEPIFMECQIWGKTGENFIQYFARGDGVILNGRLEPNNWTDKKTGQVKETIRLRVDSWSFPVGKPQGKDKAESAPERSNAGEDLSDDIPF